jgi:oligopeptide transport system ATP-binding protein
MPETENQIIMHLDHLVKHYPLPRGFGSQRQTADIHAVDDVSLDIFQGEVLGLVGETGCGKTTLAKCMVQLTKPTSGHVYYKGKDVEGLDVADISRRMQIISQDPMATLNPKKTVRESIGGNLRLPGSVNQNEAMERIEGLLDHVGLNPGYINRYPHELSGAEKQRLNLARALAFNPPFIIFDDPFSMVDMSVQAKFLNIIEEDQTKLGLTYVMISHELSVIQHTSNRVAVMYLGLIVELGGSSEIFQKPLHPYTIALFSAMPQPEPGRVKVRASLPGEIGSALNIPQGCRFHPRCVYADPECRETEPLLKEMRPFHHVACHKVHIDGDGRAIPFKE